MFYMICFFIIICLYSIDIDGFYTLMYAFNLTISNVCEGMFIGSPILY